MSFDNNDLASRIRFIREKSGLTRKEVELKTKGDIKAASLSSYENGQSQISVSYMNKLVLFYLSEGLNVSYDWLITGYGESPFHQDNLDLNLSSVKEASFFKKENKNSVIFTIENDDLHPFIMQGSLAGGIIDDNSLGKEKIRLIVKNNGERIVSVSKLIDSKMIYLKKNAVIKSIDLSKVESIYSIVWVRSFL